MKLHRLLPAVAAASALLAGCEWTGSSDSSSWSDSYDKMNFSGTYRSTSTAASTSTISDGTSETTTQTQQIAETQTASAGSQPVSGKFSKKQNNQSVVPGSVNVQIGGLGFTDDGAGKLTGNGGSGTYDGSGWTVMLSNPLPETAKVSVGYTVSYTSTSSVTATAASSNSTSVTSVTVSQNGQNLVIRLNNGIQMDGKFTAVRQTGSVNDSAGYDMYNAQFEVKSGSASKFVGTLNYDSVTGYRMIDGSWTWGKNTYDIHGVGPSYR